MYLWPKTLEVAIMDPTRWGVCKILPAIIPLLSSSHFKLTSLMKHLPFAFFGRALKKPTGILNVNVVRAYKLKKKDLLGKSDPYVKLKLSDDNLPSKKTTVKRSNLNPEWNEEFKLVVKEPESQALELSVYDWEQVLPLFNYRELVV